MKRNVKRILSAVFAAALLLTAVPAPVKAAEKADMEIANVSWDLKSDQAVTFQSYVAGVGYKDYTAQVNSLKVEDAKKEGYKKLTFSLVITYPDFTKKEVHKANHVETDSLGGEVYYTFADYETGQCLEVENDKDVSCKSTGWKSTKYVEVYHAWETTPDGGERDCMLEYAKIHRVKKVTVVYPETYKNLCLIVGGHDKSIITNPVKDDAFWSGEGKFSKSSLCNAKNNKVAHAIRIK